MCIVRVCVCVPSFIRSLRDAQVFYNVATGARVPVFRTFDHFAFLDSLHVVPKSREKITVVLGASLFENFHGRAERTRPRRKKPFNGSSGKVRRSNKKQTTVSRVNAIDFGGGTMMMC